MSVAEAEAREVQLEAPQGLWRDAWHRLRRNPGALIGFGLVATFVLVALPMAAALLPLLALLLFGVIQFGIAFNNYITLTDAVRAGARKGAVARHLSDPEGNVDTAVRAAATLGAGFWTRTSALVLVACSTQLHALSPGADRGIDALLRRETRAHGDLDLGLATDVVDAAMDAFSGMIPRSAMRPP